MKTLLETIGNLNRACHRQAKIPLLIIAIVVLIGFTMMACSNPDDDDVSIPLIENQWKEGTINKANGSIEYTFIAEYGTTYRIWLNDRQGDGSYTGDMEVSFRRSNGNPIFKNKFKSAWQIAIPYNLPFDLDAYKRIDKIYIRVELEDNDVANAGKFAIVYSTGINTSRPPTP
ncbi:MAG: hypothetical protein LBI28_09780 [Treponema sp.]|jgi:hypothetical protein|nr:hypothetical protein [Treponema sp.]